MEKRLQKVDFVLVPNCVFCFVQFAFGQKMPCTNVQKWIRVTHSQTSADKKQGRWPLITIKLKLIIIIKT